MDTTPSSSGRAGRPGRSRRITLAARRLVVTVIGVVVLAAGLAMLFLPGPGGLAVIAGLALLGTEYEWARRSLTWAKRKLRETFPKGGDEGTGRTDVPPPPMPR